jgi:hypothetical protein
MCSLIVTAQFFSLVTATAATAGERDRNVLSGSRTVIGRRRHRSHSRDENRRIRRDFITAGGRP